MVFTTILKRVIHSHGKYIVSFTVFTFGRRNWSEGALCTWACTLCIVHCAHVGEMPGSAHQCIVSLQWRSIHLPPHRYSCNYKASSEIPNLSESTARPGFWDLIAHFFSPRLPSEFEDNYDEDDGKGWWGGEGEGRWQRGLWWWWRCNKLGKRHMYFMHFDWGWEDMMVLKSFNVSMWYAGRTNRGISVGTGMLQTSGWARYSPGMLRLKCSTFGDVPMAWKGEQVHNKAKPAYFWWENLVFLTQNQGSLKSWCIQGRYQAQTVELIHCKTCVLDWFHVTKIAHCILYISRMGGRGG